jgi:hypothetical protein
VVLFGVSQQLAILSRNFAAPMRILAMLLALVLFSLLEGLAFSFLSVCTSVVFIPVDEGMWGQ